MGSLTHLPRRVHPLNNFRKILFILLLQVYEQAFEIATNEGQKSHVRAAIGMLGYISGDVDRCKFALCER